MLDLMCSRLGYLQSNINKAKVSILLEANRILHEAKATSNVTVKIQPIPINDLRFVAFSDASFASAKTLDSHHGMIIMSSHKAIGENQSCPVNYWRESELPSEPHSLAFQEDLKGGSEHVVGGSDVTGWCCGHFVLDPFVLGMAKKRKFQMANGR